MLAIPTDNESLSTSFYKSKKSPAKIQLVIWKVASRVETPQWSPLQTTPLVGELSNHDEGKPNQWGVPRLLPHTPYPCPHISPTADCWLNDIFFTWGRGRTTRLLPLGQTMFLGRFHFSLRRRLTHTNSTNCCIYLVPHSKFQFCINVDLPFLPVKPRRMELRKLALVLASCFWMFIDGGGKRLEAKRAWEQAPVLSEQLCVWPSMLTLCNTHTHTMLGIHCRIV